MPFSRALQTELSRLADLHAAATTADLREATCGLLEAAIGGDIVHMMELRPTAGRWIVSSNRAALFPDAVRRQFEATAPQHPRVERERRHPGAGALRLSDVVAWSRWQRSEYYQRCHRPLGIRDTLAFAMEGADGLQVWPVLLRVGRGFTERERDHLDALRPHVVSAWRRAHAALRESTAVLDSVALLRRHGHGWRSAGLTARECQVVACLVQGAGYRALGLQLSISAKTVEHHVARIAAKLGVRSRAEVVRRALEIV